MNLLLASSVFLFALLATSACIRLCLRFAPGLATAVPNARSSHSVPTPQIGGLCMFAVLLPLFAAAGFVWPGDRLLDLAVLATGAILCVTGVLDDRLGLSPRLRMSIYALASFGIFLSSPDLIYPLTGLFAVDLFVSGFFLLSFMNVTNFMDGIDGIVVVEFVPMLLLLAAGSALGFWFSPLPLVPAALCGALLGFFLFNRPRALTFLGDGGSVPVGFFVGLALLQFAGAAGIVAAGMLPLYFVADAAITLFFRIRRGERFWQAHRQHFYQRAIDGGQNIWRILSSIGVANVVFCGLAIIAAKGGQVAAIVSACIALGVLAVLLRALAPMAAKPVDTTGMDFSK